MNALSEVSVQYRREIDGLRTVAVLPVILFHAGFSFFSGGFIGVDVFFVISGYLITSIIYSEISQNHFSIWRFYERRVRRILPALFVLMLVISVPAFFLLPKEEFKTFSHSILAVLGFGSNFLFWLESGYFDISADLKPLLHTWSLAVEEQYYIFFPLILLLLVKRSALILYSCLCILFGLSLIAAVIGNQLAPDAAFFLLLFRSFELLAGTLSAIYLVRNKKPLPLKLQNIAAIFAFFLLATVIFFFNDQTPFPGLWTLLPILATVLLILCTDPQCWGVRLLSFGPICKIGLISYSTYLWHQPIFALSRQIDGFQPEWLAMLGLSLLSLLAGWASWRYVESIFRRKDFFSYRQVLLILAVMAVILIILAAILPKIKPDFVSFTISNQEIMIPEKFSGLWQNGRKCNFPNFKESGVCRFEGNRNSSQNRSVFLIGDSHAMVMSEVIREHRLQYSHFYDLSADGCGFLLDMDIQIDGKPGGCTAEYQRQRLTFIQDEAASKKIAILMGRYPFYYHGTLYDNGIGGREAGSYAIAMQADKALAGSDRKQAMLLNLEKSVKALAEIVDELVIVMPIYGNGWNPLKKVQSLYPHFKNIVELEKALSIPLLNVETRAKEIREILHKVAAQDNKIKLIDPLSLFCEAGKNQCYSLLEGLFLYADDDHLARAGNELIFQNFFIKK